MRRTVSDDRLFGRSGADTGPAFLSTPRAHTACQREFERICTALVDEASRALQTDGQRAPDVRRAPSRCVVQGRGAALTVAWICGASASVDSGELLAILWSGAIAERGDPIPERRAQRPTAPPVALWEATLRPVAGDASSWAWQAPDGLPHSSPDLASHLAQRLVERLRTTSSPAPT